MGGERGAGLAGTSGSGPGCLGTERSRTPERGRFESTDAISGRGAGPVRNIACGYGNAIVMTVVRDFIEAVMAIEANARLVA